MLETEREIVFQTDLLRLAIDPNLNMQIGSIGAQGIAHTNAATAQTKDNLQLLQNRSVLQAGHGLKLCVFARRVETAGTVTPGIRRIRMADEIPAWFFQQLTVLGLVK